jgi:hypothetical protein
MERDLKAIRIQTQRPSRDYSNPGRIEEAQYAVDDGFVRHVRPEYGPRLSPQAAAEPDGE